MDVAETITKSAPQDADDAIAMLGQLFAAKRSEQALVVSASGKPTAPNPADDIVSGLINRIQEQTAEFDALNASYRKQQAMTRHYQEQLADATSANADKDKEIDELRRQVRFSQENQRKSEKFVSDARAETRKLIQESDDKVKTALSKISKMRKRVNAAEAERDAATEGEKKALMERAEAVMQAEEARRALEEEQAKSEAITEEFNKQLDSFTSETLEKLQAEVDKSSAAEQSYMTSLKHIAQLERDMAESKTRFAEELAAAEQNADTRVADAVAEGKAALVGMVPGTKLEEALGQVEELTGNLGDIAKERDELQEQYKSARLLIDELNESLVRQEEEFEEYKKDAESRLEDAEAFQGRRDEARVAQEQSAVMVSSMIGMARDHENYKAATEQLLSDISSVFVDAEEDPRGELIASSIESYRDSIAEFARASKAGM